MACSSERAISTAAAQGIPETYGCKVAIQRMACHNLWVMLLTVLKSLWDEALENSGDRAVEARGILSQIYISSVYITSVQIMCKRQSKTSWRFHDSLMMSIVGQKNSQQSDGDLLSGAWQPHIWTAEVFFKEELWDNARHSSQRVQHSWISLLFAFAQPF